MLVDTHCHLNFNWFDEDRAAVIERAIKAGVAAILNPAVDLESSRQAVALAESVPLVYAAVGVHPNDAQDWQAGQVQELRSLAKGSKVTAIGEIGLDYYHERTPHSVQRTAFEQQLALAAEVGLPAVIHVRDGEVTTRPAMNELLHMLRDWVQGLRSARSPLAERPGVIHSFSGGLQAAWQAVELGFFIGITGPVTFPKAFELQRIVRELPLEKMLIETDAPFLAPQARRGQRNEPAYVCFVLEAIARLREMPFEAAAQITTENSERLFRWKVLPPVH